MFNRQRKEIIPVHTMTAVYTEELPGSETVYCHLTVTPENPKAAITLFVTTTQSTPPPMGSMVYALPRVGEEQRALWPSANFVLE